jgi:catechol 1,2-dioxygenase
LLKHDRANYHNPQAGNDKYAPLTTQIFDKSSKYLEDDSVFAVKDDLVVDFKPVELNPKATLELVYDIQLAKIRA